MTATISAPATTDAKKVSTDRNKVTSPGPFSFSFSIHKAYAYQVHHSRQLSNSLFKDSCRLAFSVKRPFNKSASFKQPCFIGEPATPRSTGKANCNAKRVL
jgi:hypothetical protein